MGNTACQNKQVPYQMVITKPDESEKQYTQQIKGPPDANPNDCRCWNQTYNRQYKKQE